MVDLSDRTKHLKDVFCYPLGPVLLAFAASNGELMKTSKLKLMHELEKGITTTVNVLIPFFSIFDGMALAEIFNCTDLTYNEFADDILKFAVSRRSGSKRIDIAFDVYYENSIKNPERGNRCTSKLQFETIVGLFQIK